MPPGAFCPYADGRKAFATGQPITACYHSRPKWAFEWEWGWRQAAADSLGDPAKIPRHRLHDEADAAKARLLELEECDARMVPIPEPPKPELRFTDND
jgi:hypothetical protein